MCPKDPKSIQVSLGESKWYRKLYYVILSEIKGYWVEEQVRFTSWLWHFLKDWVASLGPKAPGSFIVCPRVAAGWVSQFMGNWPWNYIYIIYISQRYIDRYVCTHTHVYIYIYMQHYMHILIFINTCIWRIFRKLHLLLHSCHYYAFSQFIGHRLKTIEASLPPVYVGSRVRRGAFAG